MNVAARLQSGAEPGTIVIGGATARKLHGRFLWHRWDTSPFEDGKARSKPGGS